MTKAPLKGKASGGAAVTDTTLATYDARASRYAARYDEVVPARLQALLLARITPGGHVLELGCGTGRDARFLASIGAKVLATDGSAGMLREAEIRERTSEPERRPTYRQ